MSRTDVRFIDLFCGIGGLSLGCLLAGLQPIAGFDKDEDSVDRYEWNFRRLGTGARGHTIDLSTKDAVAVVLSKLIENARPDVIVGGPPCQGFSYAGKRDPGDSRSALSWIFAAIVAKAKPVAFAMENVPGVLTMGSVANDIRDYLRASGYANADWISLDASKLGVAQKRRRVVLLGSLRGTAPDYAGVVPHERVVKVGQALAGLPEPRSKNALLVNAFVRYPRKARVGSVDEELRDGASAVTGCQRTEHSAEVTAAYHKLNAGEVDPLTSCRRLDPLGFSPALRAGSRSRTACRPVHPGRDRVITVREAARLHGYPDTFEFSPVVSQAHMQIGNSVPPPMARAIGRWLAEEARAVHADIGARGQHSGERATGANR